jgi:predicted PurR-regulated permease PerM
VGTREYLKRILLTVGVVGIFIGLFWFVWAVADVLLLVFLGILLAIALRTLAQPIVRYTPIQPRGALLIVLFTLLVLLVGGGWLFIPELLRQMDQLFEQINAAIDQVEAFINQDWGEGLPGRIFDGEQTLPNFNLLTGLPGTFADTLGILANVLFIVFIGIFVAFDPELYRKGIISLVPPTGRRRAHEVLDSLISGLQAWLLGRVISMVVIGVVVGVGLSLLGVPLAPALGVLTGLLEFIPVVGPILSAVPAILIAFTQDLMQSVYVALFFLVAQQLEGNILTPIVQQKTVSLPPALTLTAVLVMGFLFGPLGVLVATPLAAVLFILVKLLYVEDVLGASRVEGRRGKAEDLVN